MSNYNIKIAKWLLFTAAIAILPLGLDLLFRFMHNGPFSLYDLISAGQLFLISSALSASGLGEVISSLEKTKENVFHHVVTGFVGMISIVSTVGLYGYVSAANAFINGAKLTGPQILSLDTVSIGHIQIVCFILSFIVGLYAQKFD